MHEGQWVNETYIMHESSNDKNLRVSNRKADTTTLSPEKTLLICTRKNNQLE